MGMSLYVVAVDAAAVDELSAAEAVGLLLDGWSADQLGWAIGGLLFGEAGIEMFGHSASDRFGPEVQVMRPLVLEDLATRSADTYMLRTRFKQSVFGLELGPLPTADDEDWLVESARQLHELFVDADKNDKTVLFTFM